MAVSPSTVARNVTKTAPLTGCRAENGKLQIPGEIPDSLDEPNPLRCGAGHRGHV